MATQDPDLDGFEVYAYVGEDELGSGEIGLKQGRVPAGIIALVSVSRHKLENPSVLEQMRRQAAKYGKKIRLVRLVYADTVLDLPE